MFSRLCKPASKPHGTILSPRALRKPAFSQARSGSSSYGFRSADSEAKKTVVPSRRKGHQKFPNTGPKSQRHGGPELLRPLRKAAKALEALKSTTGSSSEATQGPVDVAQLAELPLSPVLDPKFAQKRAQWKQKKLRNGPTTPYEREIAANPYAQMLATPMRSCAISLARVPSAFLRPFTLVQEPSSETIWQLPKDLDPAPLETEGDFTNLGKDESNSKGQPPISKSRSPLSSDLPNSWFSSSLRGMENVMHRKRAVVTMRVAAMLSKGKSERIRVKEDNAEMIMKLLQRRCVRELAMLDQMNVDGHGKVILPWKPDLQGSASTESSIEEILSTLVSDAREESSTPGAAVLLWLGGKRAVGHFPIDMRERLFGAREALIQHPVIRRSDSRAVPVIDGESLFGEEALQWLRARSNVFNDAALLIRTMPASQDVLRWIWTLHLYQSSK